MSPAKTGRNDPCPCGSGKKYKKCCLEKDEAARLHPPPPARATEALPARPPRPPEPPPRELTPEERWWDDFLGQAKAVKNADDALSLARRAVEAAPSPPSGEWLMEFVAPVFELLAEAGRHAERMDLLEAIEARFPEACRERLAYLAEWRFESALERSDVDLVAEARRFGPHVDKVIDLVSDLPARLAWEARVPALRALLDSAWPAIHGGGLMDWAVEVWAVYGLSIVLVDHLDRDPGVVPDAPALLADLALYDTPDAEPGSVPAFVGRWLALLEPKGDPLADVSSVDRLVGKDRRATLDHLKKLSAAVAIRLRREGGWSRSRACVLLWEMGPLLSDYVARAREDGELKSPAAVVLPPAGALRRALLARSVGMFSRKLHVIAAIVFALPAWAAEVVARGWASAEEASKWLRACMDSLRAAFEDVPANRRSALEQRLIDFARGEGREVMR